MTHPMSGCRRGLDERDGRTCGYAVGVRCPICRELDQQAERIVELECELSHIDAVLARRPALDKPTRRENIEHAINTAKCATDLESENAELRAVVEKLAGPCRVVISAWNKDMIDSDLDAVGHAVNMIRVHIAAAEAAKGEQP